MTRRAQLAFVAMSVIWGVPYLLIKVAVDDGVSPALVSWARVTLAAAVLLALAARAGTLAQVRGRVGWIAAFATCEIAIPFPLIAAGEEHVPSALTAILIAAVPLLVALLALRLDPGERPTPLRLTGLLLGFAGVVALVGLDVSHGKGELLGALAILLAAGGYALGPFILKRHLVSLDPRATFGASLAFASLLLAPAAALSLPDRLPGAGALASIAVLGLLCTALAFVVFNVLVGEAGPSRASVITYVNPLVALLAGVALLGETPGTGSLAGLLLILAGSWLATEGALPAFARTRAPGARTRAHPGPPALLAAGRRGARRGPAAESGPAARARR